ncbi:hypothetical protein ANME2D_02201 [Candidatus Methanoperedens nitroreducens]|uniref:Uncharacterized protein n=1 Tax=Candidatus Methanoperedens nitratireducens TaxID=1392998 RepID=A0A062UWV5_9EURY|nr:hypothetical protein [Candidatus Methanoperedens nitroreducens]KCZ71471.1 hypothetical protein ANME2D_02201 [Candidatus Methanoperedens nitroreducens]MDJ1421100.1 hypothetical protein [Candidatus Methanoperedens sp.]
MTEIMDSERLIELVIDKHNRFLETFNFEFFELESRSNAAKQQLDTIKREIETAESRIAVLNEKYHLLFHQAKKQREELFAQVIDRMRANKAASIHDTIRTTGRIEELEKKLQTSKNIEDEEKMIAEIKKYLCDFESAAGKAGITVTCRGITDILDEANSSHRELLSLQGRPKEHAISARDHEKQINESEGRIRWLKHRIESHNSALAYWMKQKGGIKVD